MLKAIGAGALVFVVVFLVLRGIELAYHRMRKTADWSPHWGSWLFALLSAVYIVVSDLGK